MTGDGTNDAPALAQADVGVTMNTGTQAAREAGNMVDLDSNPTKLIEIVEVGKQLLITRGALTTFSIANDVAKYFAILPAIFAATYAAAGETEGPLEKLNVMDLGTPESAIISAIVFNALIIPLLVPLALRGVRYRPLGASALLRRNLWIYGLGGHHRPVRRHQADRPGRPWTPRRVGATTASSSEWPPGSGRPTGCCRRARPSAEAGRDVAIGYLEPHDRPETAAQAEGLEVIPRRRVTYRDTELEEMDLPARPRAIARAGADRRDRPHQRARASSTRSASRTSRTSSPPASTSSPRSTSSTSRASTTRSPS